MFYDLLIFIFMSYIKPQPMLRLAHRATVVYRTIPTSNHNVMQKRLNWIYVVYRTIPTSNHNLNVVTRPPAKVVYRTIPTSNHNPSESKARSFSLYIVLFLHQTTTQARRPLHRGRCISYYSYIKPQRFLCLGFFLLVVYRTIPTSNHNNTCHHHCYGSVVYRTIPTSNHNRCPTLNKLVGVVYRTIPTSNHNRRKRRRRNIRLYIVLFLHQTTTFTEASPP